VNRNESPDIRVALESPEQPEVLALVAELDAHSNELTPPESRHQADVSILARPDALFAVARNAAGRAIGCAAVVLLPEYGEVKRMYVAPPARGRGVGSAILGFLEAEAGSRGCRKLMLETGHQHHLAHRAYRANGYRVCGPFGSYGPDPLSVFMEKAIPGRPGPQTP
jgi:putative acetyltransferase